jgi:hypothetical protein
VVATAGKVARDVGNVRLDDLGEILTRPSTAGDYFTALLEHASRTHFSTQMRERESKNSPHPGN